MPSAVNSSPVIRPRRSIQQRYGRTLALDAVSLEVGEQQIFALFGAQRCR